MDDFTYGSSKAAVCLARTLDTQYPWAERRVSKYLGDFNRGMSLLMLSVRIYRYDMGVFKSILLMYRNNAYERVSRSSDSKLPKIIKGYVLNLMSKRYKEWLSIVNDYCKKYKAEALEWERRADEQDDCE